MSFGFRDYVEGKLSGQSMAKLSSFLIQNAYSSDDILDDLDAATVATDSNIAAVLEGDDAALNALIVLVQEYAQKPEAECTMDHPLELWRCHYVQEMIENLTQFQTEHFQVDAGNVGDFDESAIIRGLDHLAEVHHLFSIENKQRIRSYFREQIGCGLGTECKALHEHCSRRRELDGDGQSVDDLDPIESMMAVTVGALSSAHCYLLHSDDALYRISGQSNKFEINPFSTPVIEQKAEEKKEDAPSAPAAPLSLDLGVHVLQWLPFGVLPRFKSFDEEMVKNPASTLSPQLLEQHRVECAAKLDGEQWTEQNFDELLCLKLYSDCTKFQNLFRRAYWKRAQLETKRAFYQWAIKMYQTFLFHAQPIPKSGSGPTTLYHGLNKLFQVCHGRQ